ncbi:hypothetical protein AVEN_184777-1 [Araneus ventricosus]|uniref:Uncharacterized protein n=1 Tax=Araneus ventricosus TaxID=182803 RepID=A0A4Y2PF64_ARAVE|nr:hypothetical protein AVEN_184777-1 [Araneus ventricosus]
MESSAFSVQKLYCNRICFLPQYQIPTTPPVLLTQHQSNTCADYACSRTSPPPEWVVRILTAQRICFTSVPNHTPVLLTRRIIQATQRLCMLEAHLHQR